jgi:dolichol-phosphate mannosyltransferase
MALAKQRIEGRLSVTVVVPTYREVDNLPHLITRLEKVRAASGLNLELLIMDDDSRDGSDQLVRDWVLPWVTLVTLKGPRSLSSAVLDGLRRSNREFLVVMDADLSHPPETIPELLQVVMRGADIAVGSRFVEGGSTADDWGLFRWMNSRIATLLALPLTTIRDPMSGFFALRCETLNAAEDLQPVGYKVLLEIIVKCKCRLVVEVPIHFGNRHFGVSKLTLGEQLKYLKHLRRLYTFRYGNWSHLAQFLVVGSSGVIVNLLTLNLLLRWPLGVDEAVVAAILVSLSWNFLLNRRFSFSYARRESMVSQFGKFAVACSAGALVNYLVTTRLWSAASHTQWAAIAGILAGTLFNFTASRYLVFRARHFSRSTRDGNDAMAPSAGPCDGSPQSARSPK